MFIRNKTSKITYRSSKWSNTACIIATIVLLYCMATNNYGQQILSEIELCDSYLRNPDQVIQNALVSFDVNFDLLDIDNKPLLKKHIASKITVNEFDAIAQATWFIPDEYGTMDIAKWALDQCTNETELQRVGEELIKFQERNLFPLLRYCKYLVDTMRKNAVVWGVGRGSSVSSYVLFLIGIHKIDSLRFDLSIDEFLK